MYEIGHIQIDDPTFCYFCNDNMIAGMEKAGVDHEALLDTYIRAINVCTQGRPDDLTVSVHMCRGNFKACDLLSGLFLVLRFFLQGLHFSEGSYSRIAVKVFNTLDVDAFYVSVNNLLIERCLCIRIARVRYRAFGRLCSIKAPSA